MDNALPTLPNWLDAEMAADVAGGTWALPGTIAPVGQGRQVVGRALTALAARDDNGVIQEILKRTSVAEDVLVVAGAAHSACAILGDITANRLHALGLRALITDGPVRDIPVLERIPFSVWCAGMTTAPSNKNLAGHIGIPVSLGGVTICTGDLIIAGGSGVVVWPADRVEAYLKEASVRRADPVGAGPVPTTTGGVR